MYAVTLLAVSLTQSRNSAFISAYAKHLYGHYGAFDVSALESPSGSSTYELSTSVAPHSNLAQYK